MGVCSGMYLPVEFLLTNLNSEAVSERKKIGNYLHPQKDSTLFITRVKSMKICNQHKHYHHHFVGCKNPRWPWMAAPRQLEPNRLIWGIDQGQRLVCIDSLSFNCLGSSIQAHLGCRHPGKLCLQRSYILGQVEMIHVPENIWDYEWGELYCTAWKSPRRLSVR